MDRALRANILAKSGKAVEVAGDVDTLLLGQNRHDHDRQPPGHAVRSVRRTSAPTELGRLAALASVADQTPEGKSIVELFHRNADGRNGWQWQSARVPPGCAVRRVHRPNAHERHRSARRSTNPQRCARRDHSARQQAKRLRSREQLQKQVDDVASQGRHAAVGLRRQSHRRHGRAGRHSQAGHCASGSSGCDGWACGRSWSPATIR